MYYKIEYCIPNEVDLGTSWHHCNMYGTNIAKFYTWPKDCNCII